MIKSHRIEKKVDMGTFIDIIRGYKQEQIKVTQHTFFRLDERQRKVFKDLVIKEYLIAKEPLLVGLQYNKLYAVFYSYNRQEALKLILDLQADKIEIVTFYCIKKSEIPRI